MAACVLTGGLALGQALLEHSLAAVGGSAAGVAGKAVSDGIDKIFRSVDKQLAEADKPEPRKKSSEKKTSEPWYAGMYSASVEKPGTKGKPGVKTANPLMALPKLQFDPLAVYMAPPSVRARRPAVTEAQIAQVRPGFSREEVLNSLGRPSARVTIPEGTTLVEIYQYASRGTVIGALRLSDGVVASVRVAER